MAGQKEKIREKWLHSQKRVEISFEGEKSELKDISTCYLCGLNNESLMGVFQGSDDIGIISLLDWYIVELRLDSYKDSKRFTDYIYQYRRYILFDWWITKPGNGKCGNNASRYL